MHAAMDRMGLWEFFPIFRLYYRKLLKSFVDKFNESLDLTKRKLNDHKSGFNANNIRDVCDLYILAKEEAINDSKQCAQ